MTTPFEKRYANPVPVPAWWRSQEQAIQDFLDRDISRGRVATLAESPGGRRIRCVSYGEPEPERMGTANFNSAVGARDPETFFCRRGDRERPVLVVLAGVHGAEFEGMIGALSLLEIMERGRDLRGEPRPDLQELFGRLRLIVIPLANPDGRARVPYDGWVGLPEEEMHRCNQGTRADGSLYGWPGCKAMHPMRGDVGGLGAYFDDAGVNLMHDEWFAPLSPATPALLGMAREEAPDVLLNLHSCNGDPHVQALPYVPLGVQERLQAWCRGFYAELDSAELPHLGLPGLQPEHRNTACPPPFNLTSAFYHAGVALPATFESTHDMVSPHGGPSRSVGYPGILHAHHILFESAAQWLLDGTPVANEDHGNTAKEQASHD